jgi:NADPH:quinone reductase
VFATAGSDAKCAACVKLGAERAINYKTADFAAVVKEDTRGQGVDIVLDMVGAPYFERNIAALGLDGRLVMIGFLQGAVAEQVNLARIMMKRIRVTGSTLRARSSAEKATIAAALQEKVWPLLEQGQCLPIVHAVFALEQAAEAHRLMESSAHIGKIVLKVG